LSEVQYAPRGPQHPNQGHNHNGKQQQSQHQGGRKNSGRTSFSEESQVVRRRGGSVAVPPKSALSRHRGSVCPSMLAGSGSPPSSASGYLRPKSNSYSEGSDKNNGATMSSWLQRRKASAASTRLSNGDIQVSGVIRQPRGPDGTSGFHPGHRTLIVGERIQHQLSHQLSAFTE